MKTEPDCMDADSNGAAVRDQAIVSADLGFGHRLQDQLKVNGQPFGIQKRLMYRYDHQMLPFRPVSIEEFENDMRGSR